MKKMSTWILTTITMVSCGNPNPKDNGTEPPIEAGDSFLLNSENHFDSPDHPYHLGEKEVLNLTSSNSPTYCPDSFRFDATKKLCISEQGAALGPFTKSMQSLCIEFGGGNSCFGDRWDADFAANLRGREVCPMGATRDTSGLCKEDGHAYGPFTLEHIKNCQAAGGGAACKTLKWDLDFAINTLPDAELQNSPTFPYSGPALYNYTQPPRSFGAARSGGRLHAACDLYAPVGRNIYAVKDGTVLDFYYFYAQTYALVVDHGDFVVRYGEVKSTLPSGIYRGATVTQGQKIAEVGDLRLGSFPHDMLHFEMYSGEGSGPLTVRGNPPYQRRWDLLDPTQPLIAWPYPR